MALNEAQSLIDKLTAAGILPGGSKSSSGGGVRSGGGGQGVVSQQRQLRQAVQAHPQGSSSRAVGVVIGRPVAAPGTSPTGLPVGPPPQIIDRGASRSQVAAMEQPKYPPSYDSGERAAVSRSNAYNGPFDWSKSVVSGRGGGERSSLDASNNLYLRHRGGEPGADDLISRHSSRDLIPTSPSMPSHAPLSADPYKRLHFRSIQFIMECGTKLGLSSELVAIASCVYHGFFEQCTSIEGEIIGNYDPYLISATSLYIATKVGEELSVKLRDIVNVCYRTVHASRQRPLDIGQEYWLLRDSVVHCELLVLRMLQFKTDFTLPHRYLLHYLKSLHDWLPHHLWRDMPITEAAWSFLRDAYFDAYLALEVKAHHLAVAVLYLTVQCYGIPVAYEGQAEQTWWQVFATDLSQKQLFTICRSLMKVYRQELQVGV